MALPTRLTATYEAGNAWLADSSAHPELTRGLWDADALAPIPSGDVWLVAESRLVTGMPALQRIYADQRGPVLADGDLDRAWWLVPLEAAEELADVRELKVHPAGWSLLCPAMNSYVNGRFWLNRPDGSGLLTDPAGLAAAFGPGGYRRPAEAFG
ncbi:hypothetical protein [Streptomyces pseudovenezuelae]|uniref:Uncharacterized protein n=1 Tax=Streptomyces pseudovenezuelae TaxID=67350 RepID=A0ABT6LEY6_9ACTN|nr:hypothetical protein [Streptomyces pseudovenezuelae]MDH6214354.1 hypothetical protein [Streptomyces pseudovenezuelae]